MKALNGVVGALVTPFGEDGRVARKDMASIAEYMIDDCDAISVLGAEVSEYRMLSPQLRRELLVENLAALAPRMRTLAGVSADTTAEVIELAELAAVAGAEFAQMLLPVRPYGGNASRAEVIRFVETVASRSPLPIVLYHHPGLGSDPALDVLVEACSIDNVVAIKDSSRDISRNLRAVEEIQMAGHAQYLGTIQPMLAIMASGGAGAMTPPPLTRIAAGIRDAVRGGDLPRAGQLQSLISVFPAKWASAGLMPACKAALEFFGVPGGNLADTYAPVDLQTKLEIEAVLETWKIVLDNGIKEG